MTSSPPAPGTTAPEPAAPGRAHVRPSPVGGTGSPEAGAPDPDADAAPPGPLVEDTPNGRILHARTVEDVPRDLPPGLVVVLPGGFRMWSGGPLPVPPPPAPAAPARGAHRPPAGPRELGAAGARAAELVRLVAEVLNGRRAPVQLAAVATPRVLRYLGAARLDTAATRPIAGPHPARRRAGAEASRARGPVAVPGCGVTRPAPRLHLCRPHRDAVEACTTLTVAGRHRALAVRLDRRSAAGPWTLTAVRLI
ncbi:Rv3235 family protein [Pseudonocardia sp. HH130630-07]|uniref:Rv3235 family protein n=1 Tax=Pseudonocardia sp. HH130630-07 TaxID=1690815 RepID=UPI0008152132|nr:Rv3235 family protein [Pseudonocardia sp. HH130630-07]ANY07597.1 hypothetical protein AFB00_16305 [Pseudonocardia sp. HH130630-07]